MPNTFKIIGGEHRGRKFNFPVAKGLRPSPNKVRETLFNWLQFETANKTFLDVFAGSGAMSFEALSRGARLVFSIEKNTYAFSFLERNKGLLKTDKLHLFNQDAFEFLQKNNANNAKIFDFVLLDPPFNKNYLAKALVLISNNGFIKTSSKIYIESEFEISTNFLSKNLSQPAIINKQKKSGMVYYCLLEIL